MKDYCQLKSNSTGFHDLLRECLQQKPKINLNIFQSLLKNISGNSVYSILHINGAFKGYGFDDWWTSTYHPIYGYCDTFELDLSQDVTEQFIVQFPIATIDKIVFFHSKNNLPDKSDTLVNLGIGNQRNELGLWEIDEFNFFKAVVWKKVISRTSLMRSPCTKYRYQTCQSIKMMESLGCKSEILYSGKYLNNLALEKNHCTNEKLIQALTKNYDCPDLLQCRIEEFSLEFDEESIFQIDFPSEKYLMQLRLGSPIIESSNTVLGYDVQNLIGEVGGTFGIAIGICILDLLMFLMKVVPSKNPYNGYLKGYTKLDFVCSKYLKCILFQGIFSIILMLIFNHWSTISWIRYFDESVSTNVEIELSDHIVEDFPLVTFCPHGMMKSVDYLNFSFGNRSEDFFTALEMTLLDGIELDWVRLEKAMFYDIHNLIQFVFVKVSGKDYLLNPRTIWSSVYHRRHGLCYTLDIQKDLEITQKTQGPIQVSLVYKQYFEYPAIKGHIYLHGPMDLASAHLHSPSLEFSYLAFINVLNYQIVKRTVKSESTKHHPCSSESFHACVDRELNKMIENVEKCHLPILQTGKHVQVNKSLPACSSNTTLQALTFYNNATQKNCQRQIPCETNRYSKLLPSIFKNTAQLFQNQPGQLVNHLSIGMSEKIQKYTSKIDFGLDELVAEIGGTMGLFLGWSFFSVAKIFLRKRDFWFPITVIVCLFMSSAIWSQSSLDKYFNEKLSMEFQIEREKNMPFITICPYLTVMNIIYQMNPCARIFREPNFMGTIEHCLKNNPDMLDVFKFCTTPGSCNFDNWFQYPVFQNELYITKASKIQLLSSSGVKLQLETNLTEEVFHYQYGHCYTLDSKYWDQNFSRIEFYFENSAGHFKVFIHNSNDFPVAQDIQPSFWFEANPAKSRYLDIKPQKWSKPLTKSNRCTHLWSSVCQEVELQKWIKKEFGCKVDFLYSGHHLEKQENVRKCSHNQTLTILQAQHQQRFNCPRLVPCEHTSYEVLQDKIQPKENQAYFSIGFKDDMVEKQLSYLKVDEQTLISQIGGIFGINLGWSFGTLLELLEFITQFWF